MKKRILRLRRFLKCRFPVLLLLCLQFVLLCLLLLGSCRRFWFKAVLDLTGILIAFRLLRTPHAEAYAQPLIFLILLFPALGGPLYMIFHIPRERERSVPDVNLPSSEKGTASDSVAIQTAVSVLPEDGRLITCLQKTASFPVFPEENIRYFPDAAEMLESLLPDLQKAEHSVYLEFFLLEEGVFWNRIQAVLTERAAAGVDIRLIYDDFGCFLTLSGHDAAVLQNAGVRCAAFHPFHPRLSFVQNNRDHRKLVVIDGKVAYTGGINLTDEYLGFSDRFRGWKDCAVRVCGCAAESFAKMFRGMWYRITAEELPPSPPQPLHHANARSWVQPFAFGPSQPVSVGEDIFFHLVSRAKRRLWLSSPYLTAGQGVLEALERAAKGGVDVRILVPGVADKALVRFTSRSYYRELIGSGIRIYEYTAGFLHQKLFLCDGEFAVIGSMNLDFRSLYFQEECGICLYRSPEILRMEQDFLSSLRISHPVTASECHASVFCRAAQGVCRLIAPLM